MSACGLLLWKRDGQHSGDHIPRIRVCAKQCAADPDRNLFQPFGLCTFRSASVDRRKKEEGWSGGRLLSPLLQHWKIYSGVFPGRSDPRKRRSTVNFSVYQPVYRCSRNPDSDPQKQRKSGPAFLNGIKASGIR